MIPGERGRREREAGPSPCWAEHSIFPLPSVLLFFYPVAALIHRTLLRDDDPPGGVRGGMGQEVSRAGSSQKPPTTLPSDTLERHYILELEGNNTLILEMEGQ